MVGVAAHDPVQHHDVVRGDRLRVRRDVEREERLPDLLVACGKLGAILQHPGVFFAGKLGAQLDENFRQVHGILGGVADLRLGERPLQPVGTGLALGQFDAALPRMNAFGRIALCGLIAGYNGEPIPMANPALLLASRLSLRGFIVTEHMEFWSQGLRELGALVGEGKLKYRESVAQGLSSAPDAFIGLMEGRNFGKQLVKLI